MRKLQLFTFFILIGITCLNAQTSGLIYKPASTPLGKSVLDPNGDGYVSITSAGFVTSDYGSNSELKMISLPALANEPIADISTGGSGGHTDIVTQDGTNSVFILKKTVAATDYLIVRFRLAGASTASKGYSVLFDTDGIFGTMLSGNNPGFDREIVYETGNNGRIAVYKHELNNPGQLISAFDVDAYAQRSIASSLNGSNIDYFYDFFIPLSALDATGAVRMTATTVTSAGSGITGTISDFNGIDDSKYSNNTLSLMNELTSIFPSITLDQLVEGFDATNWKMQSLAPAINTGITTTSTSVGGTSKEANGAVVTIYKNSISIGTATVSSGTWILSGVSGLVAGDSITAKVLVSGRTLSNSSNIVVISNARSCYTPVPVINSATNSGNIKLNISWTPPAGSTFGTNAVQIKAYKQTDVNTFTYTFNINPQYYPTSGTMTYELGGNGNLDGVFVAEAIWNGCSSGYSTTVEFNNSNLITTNLTLAPTITTTPILATNTTARTITVRNNETSAATLNLYVNGALKSTIASIASNATHSFSLTDLFVNDIVVARAQSALTTDRISVFSNLVTVTSDVQSTAPSISGSYSAGSGKTVNGTSVETPGSTIYLYKTVASVTTLLGTATVDGFGNWQIASLTLAAGDVLTAKSQADGEILSNASLGKTVVITPPTAPAITTSSIVANTTTSITGTISGSTDSVEVYIDGIKIGKANPSAGNWTLSSINNQEFYKGGIVMAKNIFSGSPSVASNQLTVAGVDSFSILAVGGGAIGVQKAGVSFDVKLQALQSGSNVTFYTGTNMFSSPFTFISGAGPTSAFTLGQLASHTLNIQTTGTHAITTLNANDPSVKGSSTLIQVVPNVAAKLKVRTVISDTCLYNSVFPQQPVIEITDTYGNFVDSSVYNTYQVTASVTSGTGTLLGTQTVNINNGVATFTNLKVSALGDYTITFTSTLGTLTPINDSFYSKGYTWYGATSTDFNTSTNWLENIVPIDGSDIEFHHTPINHCILDQSRTLRHIKNAQSAKHFDLNSFALTLQGDLLFSNSAYILGSANNSKIIFQGSTIQSIPNNAFLGDLINIFEINNPDSVLLSSSGTLKIGQSFIFTNGILKTGNASPSMVIFLDNSTQTGANTASYILGKCRKIGNDAFVFPIGKNNKFAPCEISAPSSTSDYFTAEYFKTAHANSTKKNQNPTLSKSIQHLSTKEYWNIDRSGSSIINVSLYWYDATFSEIGAMGGNITLAHFDGAQWEIPTTDPSKNSNVTTMSASTGKISFPDVDSFSPFTIGSTGAVLPVDLADFSAKLIDDNVKISWITVNEVNNKGFEIEKSADGSNFSTIGFVEGAGSSSSIHTYDFMDYRPDKNVNYYRLKQLDFDGAFKYSKIVSILLDENPKNDIQLAIRPNLVESEMFVDFNALANGQVKFIIFDIFGREIMVCDKTIEQGAHSISFDVSNIVAGTYFFAVKSNNAFETKKFIIKR